MLWKQRTVVSLLIVLAVALFMVVYAYPDRINSIDGHKANSDDGSKNAPFLLEDYPFGTSFSDMSELLEADPLRVYRLDDNQYFASYALKASVNNDYPGSATCYFIDNKLGCVIYRLEKDQCAAYEYYFNDVLESTYSNSGRELTSKELDSIVLWGCFPHVIGAYYMIWDVYDQFTFSEIWNSSDDTVVTIFYDEEVAIATIASKSASSTLWDWYVYIEKIMEQETKSDAIIETF